MNTQTPTKFTAKQVINTLIEAYEAKTKELKSPKHKIFAGMKKVRDVFAQQPNRQVIYELIALMMQPSQEEAFINELEDPLSKGKQRIKVNIKTGMGLKFDLDSELEILNFINSKEFRSKDFAVAFANALTVAMRSQTK